MKTVQELEDLVQYWIKEWDNLAAHLNTVANERDELKKLIPEDADVCCCGDSMTGHSSPMNCGHTPVSMLDYSTSNLEEQNNKLKTILTRLKAEINMASKRSSYIWSSGPEYTAEEFANEGAIKLANQLQILYEDE